MAPSKTQPPPPQHHHYIPLPHDQSDSVLPSSYSSHLPRRSTTIFLTLLLLLLSSSLYVFWPSDPSLKIVRLKLKRIHVHTRPRVTIDLCMAVRIKVRNGDVYSMDYDALEVGVGYRGKRLGQVRFQQGHVRAFGSSYVDAEVEFNGVGVFSDVVLLLEDLAKGTVPFDTVTEVRGKLGVLVFHFPLQARVSCEVLVNMVNQTIFRHKCYE
ncbi:hypothetical protein ABKV19_009008 [Rosa sericea]